MSDVAPPSSSRHDPATEGLRGLAALMVIYTHMLTPFPHVDPGYAVSPFFWAIETSQGAVLLFFVLSGYVIGLTNTTSFSGSRLADYGFRRLVRIAPLYLIAVLLGVLAVPTDTWSTIAGHFFFLQNSLPYGSLSVPPLAGNTNLWSLNYEVLYYLLFPLVWLRPRLWPVFLLLAAVLGVAGWWLPVGGAVVASYAAGWTFWLAGYALSRAPQEAPASDSRLPWPSLFLLWAATWLMKPLWHISNRFSLLPEGQSAWMNWSFYDFILPCVCLLLVTTGRRPRGHRWLLAATLGLPLLYVGWIALRGRLFASGPDLGALAVLLALALWKWRPPTRFFAWFAPVGAISYALYIFHSPLQSLLIQLPFLPSGGPLSFLLRCALVLTVTAAFAWWTEKRLQPWIKTRLSPRGSSPSRAVLHDPARP